ncbi:unnamed protein product, partial [marine sediment metagenome]
PPISSEKEEREERIMTMESGDGHQKEPIECHDKCPECGSEERLVANFVAELKEKGVIGEDSFPQAAGVLEIPFNDTKKASLLHTTEPIRMIPTLRILWDVCANPECHTFYVRRVEVGKKAILNPQAIQQR